MASVSTRSVDRAALVRRLEQAALVATLLTPPFLLHAFVLAEATIALTGLLFLVRSGLVRDWAWARAGWMRIAWVWWLWLVICSLPGIGRGGAASLVQAAIAVRYLLFAAALEHWVLAPARARLWLWRIVAACAAWIAFQVLWQFGFGRNWFGGARWGDGELTGPFDKPRAAAPLARLILPALLPPVAALLERPGWRGRLGAFALTAGGLGVVILIGQRMPFLLTVLGLLVAAFLLRRLRPVVVGALIAGAALVGASAVVAPPTFYRLVTKFSTQMEHFPTSPYGEIAARAVAIAEQHPLTGRGFNGFRTGCAEPRYFHGWTWPANPADDGGGLDGCNLHPHNIYLQAVTDAGIPGLVLFAALAVAWLATIGRSLWRDPEPLRVGLFAAAFVHLWPIASASSAYAIEFGGLFFLLLGFGLAAARHGRAGGA
jgi:O-antigen ligase